MLALTLSGNINEQIALKKGKKSVEENSTNLDTHTLTNSSNNETEGF